VLHLEGLGVSLYRTPEKILKMVSQNAALGAYIDEGQMKPVECITPIKKSSASDHDTYAVVGRAEAFFI
jgi:hypothetical protein